MVAEQEHFVRASLSVAGTVEEWSAVKIQTTKEVIALIAGVPSATATLSVEPGSVKLTFLAPTATEEEAMQAQLNLQAVLSSPQEATIALVNASVFIEGPPLIDVTSVRTVAPYPSPSQPPAPMDAPPPGKARPLKRDQGIMLGVVMIIVGSIAGLGVLVMLFIFRRRLANAIGNVKV